MSAYVIVSYDIVDPAGFESYVPGVLPLLEKHGGEVVVADFEAQALEGPARSVEVVIRFPSEDAAMAWYEDPEYAPLKRLRFDTCAENRLVVAREFVPPEG